MGQRRAIISLFALIAALLAMGVAGAQSPKTVVAPSQKTPPQSTPSQQLSFPALKGLVVDAANVLSPEARARLEAKLETQERTGLEIVVATVPSLGGLSVEDYANRLWRYWRLTGVLLLIAPNEYKVRVMPNDSYCRALPNWALGEILSKAMTKFKDGDFAGGIEAGLDRMLVFIRTGPRGPCP
jgi:uncharacterized protein